MLRVGRPEANLIGLRRAKFAYTSTAGGRPAYNLLRESAQQKNATGKAIQARWMRVFFSTLSFGAPTKPHQPASQPAGADFCGHRTLLIVASRRSLAVGRPATSVGRRPPATLHKAGASFTAAARSWSRVPGRPTRTFRVAAIQLRPLRNGLRACPVRRNRLAPPCA